MAKKNPDEEAVIEDAKYVAWDPDLKHRIQVRLEDGGQKKRDGRRGQIVLEDDSVSDTVARWLMSPKCKKAEKGPGGRRQSYIWIDDVLWTGASEDIPDADAEPTSALAVQAPQHMESEAARQYLAHLYSEIRLAEAELAGTRKSCGEEIRAALDYRDGEIKLCNALIEDARTRLAKELEREDVAMQALGERRAAQAKQMIEDDTIFGLVRSNHGKRLLQQDKSTLQEVAEFISNPAGAMIAMGVAQKMGVPPELIMMLGGGQKPDEEKAE
ncbi:hypothetical protein [Nannocystis pusilla]|uniref:Terminase small subunit n=1 Tax=Nannocystis pusilla TaxID=889268 RepID=A0ABS7U4P0_9BACT|nr:hypothetical protein [Nannocystis pusilla]MBZ5715270.1 hypothetical protein [Nannocystis pusilla]